MDPMLTPGFRPALAAVNAACQGRLDPELAYRAVLVALAVAGPLIRADQLADLADEISDMAAPLCGTAPGSTLESLAAIVDQAGHDIREALT